MPILELGRYHDGAIRVDLHYDAATLAVQEIRITNNSEERLDLEFQHPTITNRRVTRSTTRTAQEVALNVRSMGIVLEKDPDNIGGLLIPIDRISTVK